MTRRLNRTNIRKILISLISLLASLGLGHLANAQGTAFTHNQAYEVQACDELGNDWSPIATIISDTHGVMT